MSGHYFFAYCKCTLSWVFRYLCQSRNEVRFFFFSHLLCRRQYPLCHLLLLVHFFRNIFHAKWQQEFQLWWGHLEVWMRWSPDPVNGVAQITLLVVSSSCNGISRRMAHLETFTLLLIKQDLRVWIRQYKTVKKRLFIAVKLFQLLDIFKYSI